MRKVRFSSIVSTFIFCYAAWILFTWSFAAEELIIGAIVCVVIAIFAARFFVHEKAFFLFNPVRLAYLLFYAFGVFVVELFKANIDVAFRVFKRKIPVNPGIVKIPVNIKSEYGLTMLANSITLTPGTITMDIADDDGQTVYYIHWIDVKTQDPAAAGDMIKGTMEKWLRRVWD